MVNSSINPFSQYFGVHPGQSRDYVQKAIAGREAALAGTDPTATRIRESTNAQQRAARVAKQSSGGGNLSVGERAQIQRGGQADANRAMADYKTRAADKYANMASNLASQGQASAFGMQGLDLAQQQINKAGSNGGGGFLGTVICTELYDQGYLSKEIMKKDSEYGDMLRRIDPYVYIGYISWAATIVKLMKKSKFFTRIVSKVAIPWAENMAYKNNRLGSVISFIGEPLCKIIGKTIGAIYGKKIQTTSQYD